MPLTTADISIQLLMDTTAALQEIEARMTARSFGTVHRPVHGPAVQQVLEQLLQSWMPPIRIVWSDPPVRRWEHCWQLPWPDVHRLDCTDL